MADDWQGYQEEAACFFRSLGFDASTDVTIAGVRTNHDIDVVVKSHHAGFDITWLVECKHWKTRVSKLHVLALREIVADVGADRGILLSEAGFQSGAIEAANLTNVRVTSLAELRATASDDIFSMRLRELFDRIEVCKQRYWDIPKDERIRHGLRTDVYESGYFGAHVIDFCSDLVSRSLRGIYPVKCETLVAIVFSGLPESFASPEAVVSTVEPMVRELEGKLDSYVAGLQRV